MRIYLLLWGILLGVWGSAAGQSEASLYRYKLNLNEVVDDRLRVELRTPEITSDTIRFYMPNIIPGTYRESNYGMFVSGLKAFDAEGSELKVTRLDTNRWEITPAAGLDKITYWVEDTYDTEKEHRVYGMSGTNIDAGEHFMIYSSGFFGYFEEMKEQPFEVRILKPASFYGSTGMIPVSSTDTVDLYRTDDYDMLIDSPLMYNRPDTTSISVANAEVLVSVYAPGGLVTSEYLAGQYKSLLQSHADYLGGQLPVDKYAFILYFNHPDKINSITGAHEHSYSSVYYLREMPQERIAPLLVDIASHEFYHIVTPLNIHSQEIAYFNYQEPDLSKHLWLYEGVTEYMSHHIQVAGRLISDNQFLNHMEDKINRSKTNYDDELPFTELSTHAAGRHNDQYTNVYQKGALIGALLDIEIIDATEGDMNLQGVMERLSERYGRNRPFEDDTLFEVIAAMTDSSVRSFFDRYVAGPHPLPLDSSFEKVGVHFMQEPDYQEPSFELEALGYDAGDNRMKVVRPEKLTEFGTALGLKKNDLLLKIEGVDIDPMKGKELLDSLTALILPRDTVRWTVSRLQEDSTYRQVQLKAPPLLLQRQGKYRLTFMKNPNHRQRALRTLWLHPEYMNKAKPEDVKSIDGIIGAMYDVISGPAGARNWSRFFSLYKPEARLTTVVQTQEGDWRYISMTPGEYQQNNAPFFRKNNFWEEEIGRRKFEFGKTATVHTAYKILMGGDRKVLRRGVNTVQLVYDEDRWWITNISWDTEREDNPIPPELLTGPEN